MVKHRSGDDAPGAEPDQVDVWAAGYLLDGVDGGQYGPGVGVQIPAALPGSWVPPAEHEGLQAAAGSVFDEAAPGPQVQEVEPPDARRDDQHRPREYGVCGRGVLQDL